MILITKIVELIYKLHNERFQGKLEISFENGNITYCMEHKRIIEL